MKISCAIKYKNLTQKVLLRTIQYAFNVNLSVFLKKFLDSSAPPQNDE